MKRLQNIRFYKSLTDPAEIEDSVAEVAFVGRSNVGKSSVLNAVCGKKDLARTSQFPGRTRAINLFSSGHGRWIVDLPGYGFAVGPESERSGWRDMIEGYLLGRPSLRMVFMLVDAKVGATKLDRQMAAWLQCSAIPFRIVVNKTDKVGPSAQTGRRVEIAHALGQSPENIGWISAVKGTGVRELEREVAELLTHD